MAISFTRKFWKNRTDPTLVKSVDPALDKNELNRIEKGILDAVDGLVAHAALTTTAHGGTTVATPYISVKDKGATGNGVTDDTAAIQAAIDAAEATISGSGKLMPVVFPPGVYCAHGLVWKSAPLLGVGVYENSVRISYNGAEHGTLISRNPIADLGGVSINEIRGIKLQGAYPSAPLPDTLLDLSTDPGFVIDHGFRLHDMAFANCLGDAIIGCEWINLNWDHLRFDHIGGWCLTLQAGGFPLVEAVLNHITWDHSSDLTDTAPGFLHVDNETAYNPRLGVFKISDARIELHCSLGAPKAFVCHQVPDGVGGGEIQWEFENLGYTSTYHVHEGYSPIEDYLVVRDGGANEGFETIVLHNVAQDGLDGIVAGTVDTTASPAVPIAPYYGLAAYGHDADRTSVFPLVGILDDFDRAAEGPPPSSNWTTTIDPGDANGMRVNGTQQVTSAIAGAGGAWWNPRKFGPDCEVFAAWIGGNSAWLYLRVVDPGLATVDGYVIELNESGGSVKIQKVTNAAYSTLGATISGLTFTTGDVFGLRAIGDELTAWQNGVLLGTRTDTTYPDEGYVGLDVGSGVVLDDFGAGDVVRGVVLGGSGLELRAYGGGDGIFDLRGSGDPDGVVVAPVGSTFRRIDGGVGSSFYVKESGSGASGWAAK